MEAPIELLLLFVLGALALMLAAFLLGSMIAALPAALLATGLWYLGVPLWLAVIIGLIGWGVMLNRLQEGRE